MTDTLMVRYRLSTAYVLAVPTEPCGAFEDMAVLQLLAGVHFRRGMICGRRR